MQTDEFSFSHMCLTEENCHFKEGDSAVFLAVASYPEMHCFEEDPDEIEISYFIG